MIDLQLPTEDETKVRITLNGQAVEFDLFDFQMIYNDSWTESQQLSGKESDIDLMLDIFTTKLAERFSTIKMSKGAAMSLITQCNKLDEDIKKKFSLMSEFSDTTDSEPVEPSPPEK